ncbi:MAG: DUF5703 domain-containing protein [Bacteroidales bacterium]
MKNLNYSKQILLFLFFVLPISYSPAQGTRSVATYDVVWNSLGTNENSSMPLGNGDLALNIWTEQNGDIVLLVAKSDAWSENGQLLKLGSVRINLTPNPFINSKSFTQTLLLETGELELRAGNNSVRIWVDANHPVVRVVASTESPIMLKAVSGIWRSKRYHLDNSTVLEVGGRGGNFWEWKSKPDGLSFDPDTILPAIDNNITWCHFNTHSLYPLVFTQEHLESLLPRYPDPLLHRCFGITMKGEHLVSSDNQTLKSVSASRFQQLDIFALTEQTTSAEAWRLKLNQKIADIEAINRESARKAHEQWWSQFWNRSWIHVTGTPEAEKISQSYAMQRYMTACAGRGAQPIKFNGSLFTIGHELPPDNVFSEANHDPDYRAWGASYWNQNTRHIYWPLIASGDYDLITPWFNMYVNALPLVKDRTRLYFHHDGGAFIETILFWGLPNVMDYGWNNPGPELSSPWMRYHIQGGLEVLAQMMDYYDNSQDQDFARKSMLPMADAVITFYDQHWKRGTDGKILFSPSQAIEMYQEDAVNPTPDIAGLKWLLPRLRALPSDLSSKEQRLLWAKVEKDLPEIPMGTTAKGKLPPKGVGESNGQATILPAKSYGDAKNIENPELYTIFPYRIYGLGKPDLQLARNTFAARLHPLGNCWGQDGMEAALLGLTDESKNSVVQAFTSYGNQSFPWFWSENMDWIPDMDNGGGGMTTLQLMLMNCDGRRIQLLPAWPKDWTTDFKLHSPYKTTVEGHVEAGKITKLKVTPEARAKDIVIITQ